MASLLAGVAACTVLLTMVLACAEHLAEPAVLSRALTAIFTLLLWHLPAAMREPVGGMPR